MKRARKLPYFVKKRQFFKLSLYKINIVLALLLEKKLEEELKEIKAIVLVQYHDFILSFQKGVANLLPLYQPNINYKIILKDRFTLLFGLLYSVSREELEILKE